MERRFVVTRVKLFLWRGVVGCAMGFAVVGPTLCAENTFDGVYMGKRVLTQGSDPTCPTEENVSATIHSDTLTFTNSALRNFAVGFAPRADGSFGEIYTGVGGSAVLIKGHIVGDVLDADVTNGPCEHHWHLTKE
jgi:hypothetical protein